MATACRWHSVLRNASDQAKNVVVGSGKQHATGTLRPVRKPGIAYDDTPPRGDDNLQTANQHQHLAIGVGFGSVWWL